MRKATKIIIGLAVACAGTLVLGACSAGDNPYPSINKTENKVSVRFDSNGGKFANTDNVNVVHNYPLDLALKGGLKLIEPGSNKLGEDKLYTDISNSGYYLAGWYTDRQPRVSDDGKPLDEDGNLCEVSGKPQGYEYSGRWDFGKDTLDGYVKEGETYKAGEAVLTLYAGWVPYFSYTVYAQADGGEWESIGKHMFSPASVNYQFALPQWDEAGVAVDYGKFPQAEDKTFLKAYADEAMTQEYTQAIPHEGSIDFEKGIAVGGNKAVYTTWKDGVWFNIYTAEQFSENVRGNGCYDIKADLDFSGKTWPAGFALGTFSGTILGNGHKFSNITVTQTDANSQLNGGLFGVIADGAKIENCSFGNVTYTLGAGTRRRDGSFGLFAGELSERAEINNVSVQGKLLVGNAYISGGTNAGYYDVGLVTGNLVTDGITFDVTCESAEVKTGSKTTYPRKVKVMKDGSVIISDNGSSATEKPETEYEK